MLGLWIAAGGALGAIGRFALSGWVTTWAFAGFPWGTFAVNALGSSALGVAAGALSASAPPQLRAFLTVGFCGGFTTFSTFGFETLALVQVGSHATAAAYMLASAIVCITGLHLGTIGARRVVGFSSRPAASD
jgi:fluoride exporter